MFATNARLSEGPTANVPIPIVKRASRDGPRFYATRSQACDCVGRREVGLQSQLQRRDVVQIDPIILALAGRASRAEAPLPSNDLAERTPPGLISAPLSIVRGAGEAAERGVLMRTGEAFQALRRVTARGFR
jgi:hypothetical protein